MRKAGNNRLNNSHGAALFGRKEKGFFEELNLSDPDYSLGVGSGTDAEQIGKILVGVENVLMNEQPDIVLVEGDTNSVFAGAYAATKLQIEVGHVEAGLIGLCQKKLTVSSLTTSQISCLPQLQKQREIC